MTLKFVVKGYTDLPHPSLRTSFRFLLLTQLIIYPYRIINYWKIISDKPRRIIEEDCFILAAIKKANNT